MKNEECKHLSICRNEKKKKQVDGVEYSGPLVIGLTIRDDAEFRKLEEIVDEERRDRD